MGDPLVKLLRGLGIDSLHGTNGETAHDAVNVRISTTCASGRGLVAARSLQHGDIAIAVPLRCARTVSTSLACLRSARKGALGTLLDDLEGALAACARLLPGDTRQVLLLALGLLAELRSPKSAARPVVRMLPAPPGSPLAAICTDGQPATDLLLFSMKELAQLQCPPLEALVTQERLRLACLHSRLFPGRQPAVSLGSFIWAHCLVRSRALDLQLPDGARAAAGTGGSGGGGVAQLGLCMIPLLDLANHRSGLNATCTLRAAILMGVYWLPHAGCVACSTVELVAARSILQSGELSISYGDWPLRDFLRDYAFNPSDSSFEVFEEFGGQHEALVVRGAVSGHCEEGVHASADMQPITSRPEPQHPAAGASGGQGTAAAANNSQACSAGSLVLQRVHMLSVPGALSLLEFDGASVCYSVGDIPQHGIQYGPGLIVQGTTAASNNGGPELGCRKDQPPGQHDEDSRGDNVSTSVGLQSSSAPMLPAQHEQRPARLEAGVEAGVCRHVATEAQALLSSLSTSIEDDQKLLQQAGPEPQIALATDSESAAAWLAWTHMHLAVQYRLARKQLLRGTASDLECQARMVSYAT